MYLTDNLHTCIDPIGTIHVIIQILILLIALFFSCLYAVFNYLYQDFLISTFLLYYPNSFSISRQTWEIIVQFWHLDFSQIKNILLGSYSKFGPAPRDPVSMLRSYLLSIKLKITSITDWVSRLKECPLYAIISGFSPDDVPGIFHTIWIHCWTAKPYL